MAHMDPYTQTMIQVDPRLLRRILSGRWAAQELSGIDPYHQENFYQYTLRGNLYMEIDPYHWSIPGGYPLGISNSGTPQTSSIVTTTDIGQVSTVGPSVSLVTDWVQGKPTAKPRSHIEFTISHYQQLNSWRTQEEMGPKRLTYEEAAGLTPTSSQALVAVLPEQKALNNTQEEVSMELMRMPDTDRFLGVYPDLRLPIP